MATPTSTPSQLPTQSPAGATQQLQADSAMTIDEPHGNDQMQVDQQQAPIQGATECMFQTKTDLIKQLTLAMCLVHPDPINAKGGKKVEPKVARKMKRVTALLQQARKATYALAKNAKGVVGDPMIVCDDEGAAAITRPAAESSLLMTLDFETEDPPTHYCRQENKRRPRRVRSIRGWILQCTFRRL